eukprot:4125472-Alexandrium_andersonii.AAC.1
MPTCSCLFSGAAKRSASMSLRLWPKRTICFSWWPALGLLFAIAPNNCSSSSPSSGAKGSKKRGGAAAGFVVSVAGATAAVDSRGAATGAEGEDVVGAPEEEAVAPPSSAGKS